MSKPRRKRLFSVMRLISLGVKAGKSFGICSLGLPSGGSPDTAWCPCLVLSSIGKKAEPAFPTHLSLCPEPTNHILLKQYLNLQHYLNAPITLRLERIVGFLNSNGEG